MNGHEWVVAIWVVQHEWRSDMTKYLLIVLAILSFTAGAKAQVSCSPSVAPQMCKAVADFVNPLLNHTILQGVSISVELLSAEEFNKRRDQIQKEDGDLGMRCGGCSPAYPGAPKYQEFVNVWDTNLLFLREKDGRGPFPTKVVASSEEFEGVTIKDGKVVSDGHFAPDTISRFASFMSGYYGGLEAAAMDGEVLPLKK
jgi:hypothetical protein